MRIKSETKTVDMDFEFPTEISGFFQRNYDTVLADDSLSDLDVILLGIHLAERKHNKAGVGYNDCKQFFVFVGRKEVNYKANIHNAKSMKKPVIDQKDSMLYLTIHGLKRIRGILGQIEKTPVHVIKSGQSFTAIKLLEQFLSEEVDSSEVLLCDSYVSPTTLFPFSGVKDKVKLIKVLTTTIHEGDKFKEYAKKMKSETGISVEVKVSGKIHDRYLISGDKCWSFGASIKDLGNKDTTIREISEVITSMKDLFLERWKESPYFS